ncbi:hypothetical protein LX36DRAFT_444368 [Colletotrichum falcatum]|nr:hypothetical protein LX36DRAFT_444368 [Colletotrichum falcatum]
MPLADGSDTLGTADWAASHTLCAAPVSRQLLACAASWYPNPSSLLSSLSVCLFFSATTYQRRQLKGPYCYALLQRSICTRHGFWSMVGLFWNPTSPDVGQPPLLSHLTTSTAWSTTTCFAHCRSTLRPGGASSMSPWTCFNKMRCARARGMTMLWNLNQASGLPRRMGNKWFRL